MKGKWRVSFCNGPQVMVKGFSLVALGYRRGAHVIVRHATDASLRPWEFVVENDETATLSCRNPPPRDWIKPGVEIEIEVEPPTSGSADASPVESTNSHSEKRRTAKKDVVRNADPANAHPVGSLPDPIPVDEKTVLDQMARYGRQADDQSTFDCYAFADYRGDKGDAGGVVLAVAIGSGPVLLVRGVSNRKALSAAFPRLLKTATDLRLRVLFGQDHQYSIPMPLAVELELDTSNWRAGMKRLFESSAFAAKAQGGLAGEFAFEVNAWLITRGLPPYFWTATKEDYGIPMRSPRPTDHPTQLRLTETNAGFPFCRLGDKGSVGGQSIVGIPCLLRLLDECERTKIPVRVWPFDDLHIDAMEGHLAIEPYPTLVRHVGIVQTDANDAIASTTWAQTLDRAGKLRDSLDLRSMGATHERRIRFEGWMAGTAPIV